MFWTVPLNHQFQEKPKQFRPSAWECIRHIPLAFRLWRDVTHPASNASKTPYMDPFNPIPLHQCYGVPLGGIGGGTIGRGWRGEFNRWQLQPGIYTHETVPVDQFILTIRREGKTLFQKVLAVKCARTKGQLAAWDWSFDGANCVYKARYPLAITEYSFPEFGLHLSCSQLSPIIPNDYDESSWPVGLFHWSASLDEEAPSHDIEVCITFTFQSEYKDNDGRRLETKNFPILENENIKGVSFQGEGFSTCIAGCLEEGTNEDICVVTAFDQLSDGSDFWYSLLEHGMLPSSARETLSPAPAAAVSCKMRLSPHNEQKCIFSLAWDQPKVIYEGKTHTKRHSRNPLFGENGNSAHVIAREAIIRCSIWREKIAKWQHEILSHPALPADLAVAMLNELYVLIDGGTLWLNLPKERENYFLPIPNEFEKHHEKYGFFAYLEGHDYRMYNTLDVHFYASFALAHLWPELQKNLLRHFASTLSFEDPHPRTTAMHGLKSVCKKKGAIPHDIGHPGGFPFSKLNAYTIHDTSQWKDLHTKFVLMVYREYYVTKDEEFLRDMFPYCEEAMVLPMSQDTQRLGLQVHSGEADQTYDAWEVYGVSAYCGGLFLAALTAMQHMALMLGHSSEAYGEVLQRGAASYRQLLWTGSYFRYCASEKYTSMSIHSDQLAGHFYLSCCGLPSYLSNQEAESVLDAIYNHNVKLFCDGRRGAINGMLPTGQPDKTSMMGTEMWTGVSYLLSATFLLHGQSDRAAQVALGVYNTIFNELGLSFQTPEALMADSGVRATGYMRPLSIWSLLTVIEANEEKKNAIEITDPIVEN